MSCSCILSDSIAKTNLADWQRLCARDDDPFMDPRFLAAAETMTAEGVRLWTALVYDDRGPAGAACVSCQPVDAALLAHGGARRGIATVRRLFPGFLRFQVLLLGLPVSASQSHLRLREDADAAAVLHALDQRLLELAETQRARAVVWKEFDDRQRIRLDALESLGYLRADSLPTHHLSIPFASLEHFCAALRSKYRQNLRASLRRFASSGLEVVHRTGADAAHAFTDRLHAQYLAVLHRSEGVLEVLPASFFRELLRQWGEHGVLTLVCRADRPVAWCCSLKCGRAFYPLFMGMDDAPGEGDIYFNLLYQTLDRAMCGGAEDLWFGANAEGFKMRLGCRQFRRHFYVKARGLLGRVLPAAAGWLFPPVPLDRPHQVFRRRMATSPPHPVVGNATCGELAWQDSCSAVPGAGATA